MNRDVCEHFNPVDLPCDKCKSANVQKSTLRGAAQQALEALEGKRYTACGWRSDCDKAITALRAALAEPEEGGNLPPPLQKPGDFDHAIGADRFKVVRGAFWWHVLIGDSPTEHGKFRSRASAEKMAADLLREFRNGAFVQHEAALAEPPVDDPHRDHWVAIAEAAQKIAASTECSLAEAKALCAALDRLTDAALAEPVQEPVAYSVARTLHWHEGKGVNDAQLYLAPHQRKPLTEEEIDALDLPPSGTATVRDLVRLIERAHGIV